MLTASHGTNKGDIKEDHKNYYDFPSVVIQGP